MSENIQLPDQSFPTTEGELNLTQIESEWLFLYFLKVF